MQTQQGLDRFITAHHEFFQQALSEIRKGQKVTHWMWFIFPQLKGLGKSDTANYYGISNSIEAGAYISHPLLGKHTVEIAEALMGIANKTAEEIFGYPDVLKLQSSMTLFATLKGADPVFRKVIDKYYHGKMDKSTLALLEK